MKVILLWTVYIQNYFMVVKIMICLWAYAITNFDYKSSTFT